MGGNYLINTIIKAIISFVSTNIDDIFVLMLFFSQVSVVMKKSHIIIGQYLAIGTLTIISIIGAFGVSVIPKEYVGLLGLAPIFIGIKGLAEHRKEGSKVEDIDVHKPSKDQNNELKEISHTENSIMTFIKSFINPAIVKVFCVTLANGGDNIGIYIPLFSSMSLSDILLTVIIFALLIGLWCFIASNLVEHPLVQKNIEKYKDIFVPIIFIGLGIFILIESGTISYILK
jgi:cadmium resistance protein CadD (predicted permease)